MELRAVQQLSEHLRDLRLDDAGAVVLDGDAKALLGELADFDAKLRKDPRLLAGVQRVVDTLADRGQKRLLLIVEASR